MKTFPRIATITMLIAIFQSSVLADEKLNLISSVQFPGWGPVHAVVAQDSLVYVAADSTGLFVVDSDDLPRKIISHLQTPAKAYDIVLWQEYIYLACDTAGLIIINISDPVNPEIVSRLNTPGSATHLRYWSERDIVVIADYYGGVRFVDVSDRSMPVEVGAYELGEEVYAFNVTLSGSLAYISLGQNGLIILDISNPREPVWAGYYEGNAKSLFIEGDRGYLAAWEDIVVLDLEDVERPRELAVISPANQSALDVIKVDDILWVCNSYGLVTYNIANLENPVELSVCNQNCSRFCVSGPGLFTACSYSGLIGYSFFRLDEPRNVSPVYSYTPPNNFGQIRFNQGYLYLAGKSGLTVVDFADQDFAQPNIIGSFGPGNAYMIGIEGNWLYLCEEYAIDMFDISEPGLPQWTNEYRNPYELNYEMSLYNWDFQVSNNYIYLARGQGVLDIIDVLDEPEKIGEFRSEDTIIRLSLNNNILCMSEYSSEIYRSRLRFLDISDPRNPTEIGSWERDDHNLSAVTISGTYAYASVRSGLEIIDYTNLDSIHSVGRIDLPEPPKHITLSGVYALLSISEYGIFVVDVTDPANPMVVDTVRTPGKVNYVSVEGSHAFAGGKDFYAIYDCASLDVPSMDAEKLTAFSLCAYPNPFNSTVTITFSTGMDARPTRLGVYDLQGRMVADLPAEYPPFSSPPASRGGKIGEQKVVWDAGGMAAGVYIVKLDSPQNTVTRKMVLIR